MTSAEAFANAAQSLWGIENSLHWVLDVTFREDDCRVRKDLAPHSFAALRKFALALPNQDTQYPQLNLRSPRKTAGRIPDCQASLLPLTPSGVDTIALLSVRASASNDQAMSYMLRRYCPPTS